MNQKSIFGECFFLDVGQGTANVIILPRGRALIVDVGPLHAWPVLERLLRDRGVKSIECILISHNDDDHIGGLELCAINFGHLMEQGSFFLLQDRPLQKGDALDLTLKMALSKEIPMPRRAEAASMEEPTKIWSDENLSLELWYPSMYGAVRTAGARRPNDCCAVAMLRAGPGKILFTGDASAKSWRMLAEARPGFSTDVDIMTVPHHGGSLRRGQDVLNGLVKAKHAVVSVGTHNSYGHPMPDVIKACSRGKTGVLCTQITSQCHALSKLGGRNVMEVHEHSASGLPFADIWNKAPVACAGTVKAILGQDGIMLPQRDRHAKAVKDLDSPLCIGCS